MANRIHLKHTKSSATTATTEGVTIPRLPSSGDLLHGEIAINYRSGYETLFIKNSSNDIVPFATNNHLITATPNSDSALIQGQIGIDMTDVEGFYIYNAARSGWQPLSTNHVEDESGLEGIPTVQDPQIAYVKSTGLVYISQYDGTASAQTWVPMASLVPSTKKLAHGQETRVVIDSFDAEKPIAANTLIYNSTTNKLSYYGPIPQGGFRPELLDEYTPSKDVVYYKKNADKFFIWNGSAMIEIRKDEIPIFSANTGQKTILYNLTTTANTASGSNGSIVLGHNNSVSDADMVTVAGVGNTVNSGGDYSFVEGYQNEASGLAAHAEGGSNKAYGNYSHAEGYSTRAQGGVSHAEGHSTSASGAYSHAEGHSTSARGDYSHAEGEGTSASGRCSHAEGYNNIASGDHSHVGGRHSLAAGRDSLAYGYANSAYCAMSIAMGSGNIVGEPGDANSAVAASSVALGRANSAMGYASFACGHYNYADGMYANAIGKSTSARSVASHSEGILSVASAMASHAEGAMLPKQLGLYESDNSNYDARVYQPLPEFTGYTGFLLVNGWLYTISRTAIESDVGYIKVETDNAQLQAQVSGHTDSTTVSAQFFDSKKTGAIANGIGSHSEGFSTYSEGQASHTEGISTSGLGDYSHAEGYETTSSGLVSHAEGYHAQANGSYSHAEGYHAQANGSYSHAEGNYTYANGKNSHAGGYHTSAIGNASYAIGSGTVTNNAAEFACGKYNVSATGSGTTMFSVGIGSHNHEKNALEVRADGKIYFYDNNGNQVCLQDILQALQGG